ncbi:hypothetical protein JW948_14730 [bacterium]|nr:hypothetical protein [bacterium]
MHSQEGVSRQQRNGVWNFIPLAVFIFIVLYTWLRIDPGLIHQFQDPLFLLDSVFFRSGLHYPGGLADYAAAFLSQFLVIPWLGAFIITILSILLYLLTSRLIGLLSGTKNRALYACIPVMCLPVLYGRYDHSLAVDLGLLLTLFVFILFIRYRPRSMVIRLLLYLAAVCVLYLAAAGHMLLFAVLTGLYDALHSKQAAALRLLSVFFTVLIAMIIPFLSVQLLFMIPVKQAFLYTLPFSGTCRPPCVPWLLYGFFPLLVILVSPYVTGPVREGWKRMVPAGICVLLVMLGTLAEISFDRKTNKMMRMDRYACRGQWAEIVDMAEKTFVPEVWFTYFTNRALYHTGRLPEDMFRYAQVWGTDGLFLPEEYTYRWPMLRSDLLLELGYVNESQHMACEGLSQMGEKPRILRRLAVIHLLKGEKQAAMTALLKLRKTLFHKNWANKFIGAAESDSLLQKDPELKRIRTVMPRSDFILVPEKPLMDMENLLKNRDNRMAFEYLMTGCLLEGDLDSFIGHIQKINSLNYPAIPRHFEEAMILYMMLSGQKRLDLPGRQTDPRTVERYQELRSILARHGGRKEAARKELSGNHRDTFWYYLLYIKPVISDE